MTLRSAICFFAHPDDETGLAGGLIHMLVQRGVRVTVVCATRGEGGELGEPPAATRATLGAVREAELRCAAQALGATLHLLDYIDPVVGPDDVLYPFDADPSALAGLFARLARGYDLILTHGGDGEYGHPAHQQINRAVLRGIPVSDPKALVYTVAAAVPNIEDFLWNKTERAHFALDIRPWSAAKLAAMECHRTQHALFLRDQKLEHLRDALRTVESVRRQNPPVPPGELPQDAFADLLQIVGAWTPRD